MLTAAKEEAVVREYYKTHLLAKSYQAVFPGVAKKTATDRAKEILSKPENVAYMQELIERNAKKGYASLDRVKSFLTEVMEGKVKDQFGLDASLSDRIKAAEDIIRCEGGFKDKSEVSLNVNVADMLKAARERATNRSQLPPVKNSPETIDVEAVSD
jgi:hypothetical protein